MLKRLGNLCIYLFDFFFKYYIYLSINKNKYGEQQQQQKENKQKMRYTNNYIINFTVHADDASNADKNPSTTDLRC